MSDFSDASAAFMDSPDTGDNGAAPASGETTPETTEASAPPAPAETEPAEAHREQVPWGEYRKVQQEAAKYREQARSFEAAFGRHHPDDAKFLLGVIAQLADDPAGGAATLREIAKVYGPEVAEAVADAAEGQGDDDADADRPMTRKEFEAAMAAQHQEQQVAAEVQGLHAWAQEKGLNPDEYVEVLTIASSHTGNDVEAALGIYREREQRHIDEYLAGKRRTADGSPIVTDGQAPVPVAEKPKTFEDASAALRASLASGG